MTAVSRRWAGLGGPCCFIGDGVELSQEIQSISYVIEGVSRACGTLNAVTVASHRWPDSSK